MLCAPYQIFGDKNEMNRACSEYGGEEWCMRDVMGKTRAWEGGHLEDQDMHGGMILKYIFEK
jgi:hypothetical protein